ncbi:acyltransferase family protein [Microbacterium sp. MEJ108Y]|uniref:acyltransferase family protein n=1 Tax=Microbacterium sp. MEJ108Y TaxID=1587523 RepID=UPI000698A77E|nr:acyltransferase [Microbacterium sp. MEJ108Y]
MAIVEAPSLTALRDPLPAGRDTAIDFLRAVCVAGVVLLHAIMVGVTVVDGSPVFANASDGSWWIVPVSWVLQVMPLFFIIGGFAGYISFRRMQARGGAAASFIAARVHRLLRPALFAIGIVGAALAALSIAGVPADIIAVAGFRYSQPLWFLAVFLGCQALLPALAKAHARKPLITVASLVAAALAVDALRAITGFEWVGFLNLAFVWLALQQIGFFLADGTIDGLSRRARAIAGASASITLVGAFTTGVYSPDLIANINPPTGALLLVGVVHLSAVSLLRDRIDAFSRRPAPAALAAFVNRRTMTIYLWHMPTLLAMAGICAMASLSSGIALPEPSTLAWWVSRPLWLAAALTLTAAIAVAFTRVETQPSPPAADSTRRIAIAAALGVASVVLLLVAGTTVLTSALAAGGMLLSQRLARRSHQTAGGESVADLVRVA